MLDCLCVFWEQLIARSRWALSIIVEVEVVVTALQGAKHCLVVSFVSKELSLSDPSLDCCL